MRSQCIRLSLSDLFLSALKVHLYFHVSLLGLTHLEKKMSIFLSLYNLAYRDRNTNEVSCSSKDAREYSHGLKRFYEEAKTLATLKGEKNIVEIWAYLKANNTAYIVMEYVDGINLKKNMTQKVGTYSYEEAERIFKEIAVALEKIHAKKLLHRDLTPENVLIKKDGAIKIIDFGSARDYIKNATGMSVMVKSGYAPVEQYSAEKKTGTIY